MIIRGRGLYRRSGITPCPEELIYFNERHDSLSLLCKDRTINLSVKQLTIYYCVFFLLNYKSFCYKIVIGLDFNKVNSF